MKNEVNVPRLFFITVPQSFFFTFLEPVAKQFQTMSCSFVSELANYHGNRELSNTQLKVSDILRDPTIRDPRKQTLIDSFFSPT